MGALLHAVERGWMPDAVVRIGIRRLLRARLREIQSMRSGSSLADFVRATQAQPIAVTPGLANQQHYEVPAAFFQQVLGQRLKYSCCYWTDSTETLDDAEVNALRITCENAQIENGMDVLELGCGWGALSLWMAQQYPECQITAVSNSHSQREYIQAQASERGLANLTVVTADMNEFASGETFDRIVSVEMFEHMRNHRRLMNRIANWLAPDGKLFVHVFCHQDTPYTFRSDGDQNWMGRHFFSGGMMPSEDLLESCGSNLSLSEKWRWGGKHYAKTCRAWLANQDRDKQHLLKVLASDAGGESAMIWHNRWRLFFLACQELFAFDDGKQWFVSHSLFQKSRFS